MTHANAELQEKWIGQLTENLALQQDLVRRLHDLAERQDEQIRNRQTDALLSLLSQRQQVIDHFLRGQDQLRELTSDLDQRLVELNADQRAQIRQLIDEINRQLAEVLALDETGRELLEVARGEARKELSSLKSARQARNAYIGPDKAGARFADRKG